MKEKIEFEYDSYTDNLYVTLKRFNHKTTGTITELARDVHAMIDLKRKQVIGLLITNYSDVSKSFYKDKNEETSKIMFYSRLHKVATMLEDYLEKNEKPVSINKIQNKIRKELVAA